MPYQNYLSVSSQNETPLDLNNRNWVKDKASLLIEREHQCYWIRLKLKNDEPIQKKFYLMNERHYTYALNYFLLKNKKIVNQENYGFYSNKNTSSFNGTHLIIPLVLEKNEEVEIFFKVQNFNRVHIPFKIVSQNYISDFYQTYNFLQGIVFGVLIIMAFYNLILYFMIGFKPYIYYVYYIFFLILYLGVFFGYFQRYTNIDSTLIYLGILLGPIGFLVMVIFFLRELFSFKEQLPIVNKIFTVLIIYFLLNVMFFLFSFYLNNFYYVQLVFNLISLSVPFYIALILFTLYSLAYKDSNHLALYYALIWTFIGVFGLALVGMNVGFLSTEIGVDYIFEGAVAFESVLFSLMLALRMREIEKDKLSQEKLLVQQNKLASMGEMISIIAHQWRQPLSEINGIVLKLDIDYRKENLNEQCFMQSLNEIETTTEYLSQTIHDFMNFFKHDKVVNFFCITDAIGRAMKLLVKQDKKNVKIIYENPMKIELYSYQSELIQALLIVLNNSIDAIVIKNIKNAKIRINVKEQDTNILISIEDNAGGIPFEMLDKIYNPYFTTKHNFKGTGLGLYILKMLIEQSMQGSLQIQNVENGLKCIINVPNRIT
jgi:signal transduction histidine kinase